MEMRGLTSPTIMLDLVRTDGEKTVLPACLTIISDCALAWRCGTELIPS